MPQEIFYDMFSRKVLNKKEAEGIFWFWTRSCNHAYELEQELTVDVIFRKAGGKWVPKADRFIEEWQEFNKQYQWHESSYPVLLQMERDFYCLHSIIPSSEYCPQFLDDRVYGVALLKPKDESVDCMKVLSKESVADRDSDADQFEAQRDMFLRVYYLDDGSDRKTIFYILYNAACPSFLAVIVPPVHKRPAGTHFGETSEVLNKFPILIKCDMGSFSNKQFIKQDHLSGG